MNKKLVFGLLVGVVIVCIAFIVMIGNMSFFTTTENATTSSENTYTEAEYNKLVDEHFKEKEELKGDISTLESKNKVLDAEVKKLKEELAKKEQASAQTVTQEQPKKEEPKKEQEQPTGAFANPVKSIDKASAMNKVKEKAKQDFPNDYMTQNFVADEQSKAFDFLNGVEIKSQEELNVMKKAIGDFPNDFMTAKFVYEEQMKAKSKQE
ncbi:hypothetical protein [Bacillus cereus]|uniref:Uncharacterized protein n=1 Tax=Bacillus cereus TaxID=1396 RepID=A0AA44Q8J2_BACCE|nr:hypothetical protein [Bacillus cereus]PFN04597.1 hypothetical protein COJ55_20850 [Bacillus cereus]PFR99074.1 hypothetical protein COK38_17180 [Bacillus cereus]